MGRNDEDSGPGGGVFLVLMILTGIVIFWVAAKLSVLAGKGLARLYRWNRFGRALTISIVTLFVIPVADIFVGGFLYNLINAVLLVAAKENVLSSWVSGTLMPSLERESTAIWVLCPAVLSGPVFGSLRTRNWWIPAALAYPMGMLMLPFLPAFQAVVAIFAFTALAFVAWHKAFGSERAIKAVAVPCPSGNVPEKPGYNGIVMDPLDADMVFQILNRSIIGQDNALRIVANRLAVNTRKRRESPSLEALKKPIAVFLAVGPTGVGKTETAKALAKAMKILVDKRYDSLNFDMSEFYDRHTAARLVGSPPGYIGSEEPGQLTGALQKNPFRVVLFDEIEKGHPSVMNTFLQIFDEGRLTDASKGHSVFFTNTIVVLTSNLANEEIGEILEHTEDPIQQRRTVLDLLKESGIRPEILARIHDIVPYRALTKQDYIEIVAHWADDLPRGRRPVDSKAFAEDLMKEVAALMPYGVREILRSAEEKVYLQGRG